MQGYDQRIADNVAKEKAMEMEAAENDGWVTVTGQKKRGQFALSRKESAINKVQHKEDQKNKKKQLLNFYTFQIRESKKQSKYHFISRLFVCKILILRTTFVISVHRFSRTEKEV